MAQVEWTMEDHLYQCILPLRCLLTKELEPAHWAAIEVRIFGPLGTLLCTD